MTRPTALDVAVVRQRADLRTLLADVAVYQDWHDGLLVGPCLWCTAADDLQVSDDLYRCYCGAAGDVYDLAMYLCGGTFDDAVRFLAARFDIPLEAS